MGSQSQSFALALNELTPHPPPPPRPQAAVVALALSSLACVDGWTQTLAWHADALVEGGEIALRTMAEWANHGPRNEAARIQASDDSLAKCRLAHFRQGAEASVVYRIHGARSAALSAGGLLAQSPANRTSKTAWVPDLSLFLTSHLPSPSYNPTQTQKTSIRAWQPSKSIAYLPAPHLVLQDKIDHPSFTLPHPTPPSTFQVSETPPGPLSQFTTSRSFGFRFTATIPPYDLQSFTTDIQQPWLTQPPSTRLTTQTTLHEHPPQADFVLFPSPSDTRPVRRPTELAQETSSTPLNHRLASNRIQLNRRRNSTQPTRSPNSASPFQNPRVRNSIQGTGSSTSSQRFHPNGNPKQQQQHNFYASSAPSSTSALHPKKSRTRPPVPLFTSSSTGNLPDETHTMSIADSPNGIDSPPPHDPIRRALTLTTTDLAHDFFDFSNEAESPQDHQIFQDSNVSEMDYGIDFSSPMFNPINAAASGRRSDIPQTISPKDVFIDSNPSSSVITNMTTPASLFNDTPMSQFLDSPAVFSNNTSPWDDEYDIENQTFPSLFAVDNTPVDDGLFSEQTLHQSIELMGPPQMMRNKSSPGSGTSLRASHSRHSSIAGIRTRKRKEPLPPIAVGDEKYAKPEDIKRARNTMAARKSREKKVQRVEELEVKVQELQQEVAYWRSRVEGQQQFGR